METEVVKWLWQSDVARITPFEDHYKMESVCPFDSILTDDPAHKGVDYYIYIFQISVRSIL